MATRSSDVIKLQRRVAALERKVATLEAELAQRGIRSPSAAPATHPRADDPLWSELLAKDIIRLPTQAELDLASEWQALPDTEKESARKRLRKLKLQPTLSEIIHRMRAGWYPDESEWAPQP